MSAMHMSGQRTEKPMAEQEVWRSGPCCQADVGRRRCRLKATKTANGLRVCAAHEKRIKKIFADAYARWVAAGEPESDL